jgi:hypothetical protein
MTRLPLTVATVLVSLSTPLAHARQAPPASPKPPSATDRAASLAKRLAGDVLPASPDRARILDALAVAGLPVPGEETTAAIVATAAEAYAEWRKVEEPALVAAIASRVADPANRGSPIGPEMKADVVRRWDDGFRFERDALEDLIASQSPPPPESDVAIARNALAAAEANALFGRVPLGTIDPKLDLVREATRCLSGTDVAPARIRELLGGYAKERADLARKLAERRLETIMRSGEVALAVQSWFARRLAEAGVAEAVDPAEVQGLGIVLQMAPMVAAAGEWQDLQRRAAGALDTALPPDQRWCVWASLPPGAGGAATRETIERLAATAATLPGEARAAAEATLRDFRQADLASIRELLSAEIETGQALGRLLAPSLEPGGLAKLDLDAFATSLKEGEIRSTGLRLDELQKARKESIAALESAIAPPSSPPAAP